MNAKIDMEEIYAIQRGMQSNFTNTPLEGKIVKYLDKEFIVFPTVFHPSEDSKALVQHLIRTNKFKDKKVLDLCTGSGVIAIYAAIYGAESVVALDINPEAIRATKENAQRYNVSKIIEAKVSDMYSSLDPSDRFDVITMNPPFTPHEASNYVEQTMWDNNFQVHHDFFKKLNNYLAYNEHAHITQSSFGAVNEMKEMADQAGFNCLLVGKNYVDELRTFYAFQLSRK